MYPTEYINLIITLIISPLQGLVLKALITPRLVVIMLLLGKFITFLCNILPLFVCFFNSSNFIVIMLIEDNRCPLYDEVHGFRTPSGTALPWVPFAPSAVWVYKMACHTACNKLYNVQENLPL